MARKTWTATARHPLLTCRLQAQYRGGRTDMLKILRADDPCWTNVKMEWTRMWDKKHFRGDWAFRRGLAVRAFK